MGKGLVGFNCDLPGGLTTMYVNDDVRDAINGGVLPSGRAANVQGLISVLDDFFGDSFWFVQPVGVNNNPAMLAGVQPVFPNAYANSSPVNYSVNGVSLVAHVGNLSGLNGWGDGAIPPASTMENSYTILGHSVIARYAYEVRVCFPVFRASEIDFENKTINITDDTPTLDEICWIEIAWRTNTFDYAVEVTPASPSAHLRGIYERAKTLGTAPYDAYVGSQDDPYNPGGESDTGGGEGDFDNTSDPIPEASLPTLSAVDAKFISIYTPTLSQLQALANYMWSPLFDLDTLKKLFADPMKVILGLSIVPFAVPSSGQQVITIGNISTNVQMNKASQQYVQIDCGTLNVNEYWGAYLDYSPYTKLEIYLPYIGTKQISVDDVMNKACHVYYNVDILTGSCCAMIKCDDSVLYSYAGQCAVSIPITGSDWTNVVSGAISIALTAATYHAAGKISPNTRVDTLHAVSSIADDVMQMKPTIDRTGSIAGSAGMLGVQTPYLILTRPRQALPKNQNHYTGYPSFVNVKLGDLTGMTFVEQVHLENIPCTSSEQSEIETLLKGGVIF